ncbi:hypothetical protein JCM33374_g190 [Metschnikowia sp. JCM 33374]|nr:hypothetical protein JCM33374_g190 [Metschnikowia sp. JCM 33374]
MDQASTRNSQSNASYLTFLKSKKSDLNERKKVLLDLSDSFLITKKNSTEDVTLHIGCGFWTTKSPQEALEFIRRQINHLSDELKKVSGEIATQSNTMDNLEFTRTAPLPEDVSHGIPQSLPIVEIQELLDDDGNVIDAKVNDEPFPVQPGHFLSQGPVSRDDRTPKTLEITNPIKKLQDMGDEKNDAHIQIDELLQDMEIINPRENPKNFIEGGEYLADQKDAPSSSNPTSIYELELIAGQFHTEDDEMEESDDFDYDFEDSDDEPFENESNSNFMSSIDTSILPGNASASDRLRNEIIALRRSRQGQDSTPSSTQRRVHFNDTLEIKEIENVSKELVSIEHKKQKVSRFKETKMLVNKPLADVHSFTEETKPSEFNDVMNSTGNDSSSNDVMSDVFERTDERPVQDEAFNLRDESCPHAKKETSNGRGRPRSAFAERLTQQNNNLPVTTGISEVARAKDSPRDLQNNPPTNPQSLSTATTFDEEQTTSDQMDILVKAYHQGDFDGDINVAGPVVNRLDDFKVLNKMIESMSVQNTERLGAPTGADFTQDETNEVGCFSSNSSDDEIMADSIIEREMDDFAAFDEINDLHDADQVQQYVMEREIAEQYYRLKRKITSQRIPDSEEEEIQDIKNMSRFMSRQLQGPSPS